MAAWKRHIPSITEELVKTKGPLWEACHQPQLMHVKYQDYGLKKLYKRLNTAKHSRK